MGAPGCAPGAGAYSMFEPGTAMRCARRGMLAHSGHRGAQGRRRCVVHAPARKRSVLSCPIHFSILPRAARIVRAPSGVCISRVRLQRSVATGSPLPCSLACESENALSIGGGGVLTCTRCMCGPRPNHRRIGDASMEDGGGRRRSWRWAKHYQAHSQRHGATGSPRLHFKPS